MYQRKEDFVNGKFIGRLKLQFIFEVSKYTDNTGKPAFSLGVSMHETRRKKQAGKKDIHFSCYSIADRDRWTAAIDFLKTRAIY